MAFFFFGTLMDRDVLERVLGRRVPDGELTPARLPGYRRVKAAAAEYPTLVPAPGGAVDGVLLRSASRRDAARIVHFEGEEYEARVLAVRLQGDGRPTEARVFVTRESVGRTDERWELSGWARHHKGALLDLCDEWMRDCPEP